MKVLFAVSNEEISESIVKRYQKEYKEIISYKNVYYFNAILKELQKDKNYDRVVISEELEAFTNSQYSQIDKFIFDKLDSISDEASNAQGDDIPIILICSDRREKSEEMIVKLFGIGIYNALIGNDRSVNNVCSLLKKPRLKKEAKLYYKIDSEDVSYQSENENDVSEAEIQNILAHYKRLGKDEKKYIESFDNIASQYNDIQLRIISKFLPLNVRAVLEEQSPKYQQIIAFNSKVSDNLRALDAKKEEVKEKNGTSEKFLSSNDKTKTLSRPVVIPSSVNVNSNRKLAKIKNEVRPIENVQEKVVTDIRKIGPSFEEKEEFNNLNNTVEEDNKLETLDNIFEEDVNKEEPIIERIDEEQKRGRGRPRKYPVQEESDINKPKRGRGRPRKYSVEEEPEEMLLPGIEKKEDNNNDDDEDTMLPGFNEIEETEEDTLLPGFDDITEQDNEEETLLPGFDDIEEKNDEEDAVLPGFDDEEEQNNEEKTLLPGFDDIKKQEDEEELLPRYEDEETVEQNRETFLPGTEKEETGRPIIPQSQNNNDDYNSIQEVNKIYDNVDISNLLTSDKKIACFVGTSKNGTSFIVNNLAEILSQMGVNTAILDVTKNRNSYYIYTKNEEDLRKVAMDSINNLLHGSAKGIQVNRNLTVYTSLPEETEGIENAGIILQTLLSKHQLVLIDCDFDTSISYFEKAQEIYLVQTFDILTIQPLTAFLRELKSKNVLRENRLKIVLNKALKLRGITDKTIIGGMAYYNDPAMSFMTELFDKNSIRYITIPFNEEVYTKYLDGIINCEISIKGYPNMIIQTLNQLANIVYPTISGKGSYASPQVEREVFSPSMNSTLDQMKKRF